MDDALLRLLEKPQADWQKPELEQAFVLLAKQYLDAMDGWGAALDEGERLGQMTTELAAHNRLLALLVDAHSRLGRIPQAIKRGRGRTKKHHDLSWLDGWYSEQVERFGKLNDRPLIKKAFEEMFATHGLRRGRVDSEKVKSQMESFRKLLVERRYELRRLSRNKGIIPTT